MSGTTAPASAPGNLQQQQRKRKRLNAVLDKLSNNLTDLASHNGNGNGNDSPEWHENNPLCNSKAQDRARVLPLGQLGQAEVFRFDNLDGERRDLLLSTRQHRPSGSDECILTGEPVSLSPVSGRSPHSSLSSPQVRVDSREGAEEDSDTGVVIRTLPGLRVRGSTCDEGSPLVPLAAGERNLRQSSADAKYPTGSTAPTSATALHLPGYLTEAYKRRCLSDTNLAQGWSGPVLAPNTKDNISLDLENSNVVAQDSPLDLSVKPEEPLGAASNVSNANVSNSSAHLKLNCNQYSQGQGHCPHQAALAQGKGSQC